MSASFRLVGLALLCAMAGSALGCSRPAPDSTPEGALRAWLEKMEAAEDDPAEMRAAYELFGPRAKKGLAERAERAGRAEGRKVEPWEVLADGRFGLKFRPQRMTVTVDPRSPDEAVVAVVGADPNVERGARSLRPRPDRFAGRAAKPRRRSHRRRLPRSPPPGGWRVEPDLPPAPPKPHER